LPNTYALATGPGIASFIFQVWQVQKGDESRHSTMNTLAMATFAMVLLTNITVTGFIAGRIW